MLGSIPAALLAVLWPLAGALLVVALNRLLPNWLGRLLAVAASIACLVTLASLVGKTEGAFRATWEPFTFLRASPALQPTAGGLTTGIILAAWSALAAVGIRGAQHPRTTWYGFNLVLLAGGVLLGLASNLLALALGSALLDLALLLIAVSAVGGAGQSQRATFRMCAPGLVSTGLVVAAAFRMDADTGAMSLSAQGFSAQVVALLAAAGLFRLAVFPLHPRGLSTPEQATGLILSMGAGNVLLARGLVLGEMPAGTPWFMAIGAMALLAGGWLAWSAGSARPVPGGWAEIWGALAIGQAGAVVLFSFLFPGAAPWPLAGMILAPGLLVLWWDATLMRPTATTPAWAAWVRRQVPLLRARLRAWKGRLPFGRRESDTGDGSASAPEVKRLREPGRLKSACNRLRNTWLLRRGAALLPAVGLASLAGVPLTAGAVMRWHVYGMLLAGAHPGLLAALLVSDTLLAGGLILAWKGIAGRANGPRIPWVTVAAMGLLAACSIALWLAPGLWARTGLSSLPPVRASVWGVGILFVLPWLPGAWLAKVAGSVEGYLERARRVASAERASRPLAWLGQKLLTAVYWLGSVGEGEGWWGWVLVVLALGALYLAAR